MAPLSASVNARTKKARGAIGKRVAKKQVGSKSKGVPKKAADAAPAGQKRKRPTAIVPSASKRARKEGGTGQDEFSVLEGKQRVDNKKNQATGSERTKVRVAKKEEQPLAANGRSKVNMSGSSALQKEKKPARAGKTAEFKSALPRSKGTELSEDGKSAAGQDVKRRPGRPKQSKGRDESNGGEGVAVKRGRGRPKNSKEKEEGSGAQERAVKRGRGRPKGSKNRDKGSNAPETAVKREHGQPKESKKTDKPSGSQETAVKRGRGRPKRATEVAEADRNAGSDQVRKSGQKGGTKKAPPPKAKYLDHLEFDGTLFEAGDFVYIKKTDGDKEESDEELEECRVCGNCPQEGEDMLECDTCLGGFHLGCLDPPLEEVPEGDWNCPACCGAECGDWVTRTRQRRRTLRERFLAGELYMARVNMMWQEPNGDYYFRGNWVDIPEETHMGRREHNHRREVFLSTLEDDVSMGSIIRHAWVYPRERFEQAANEGDDVYLLEYGYCPRTQRYKRIDDITDDGRGWNYEVSDEDGDFRPSKDEDGVSDDEEFSADDEKEDGQKTGRRGRKATGTKRKRKEGTEPTSRTQNARRQRLEALAQLGAKEIPAAARKRKLTRLEAAQEALTLAALPKKLSCRDKERQQVTSFVEEAVSAGADCLGSCLYISGVPGTGKTATVLEVMRGLRRKVEAKELPPFQFVEINALRVPSPAHVYTALHEALTGEYLGPKAALERLQQRFEGAPRGRPGLVRRPLVVLVDELDLLVTRNQSVLYNIFDWPTLPHSRLIVIGIANTIDLPERMLPRIASRMGLRRVAFNPYTREQLQEIVADRLTGIPAFRSEAIELASRKVASASGDVRRALELCRRAAELAAARQKEALTSAADVTATSGPKSGSGAGAEPSSAGGETEDVLVELGDVDAAVREMFDSPHIKSIERLSRHEQILLLALVMISRRTGIAETNFETVAGAQIDMCRSHGELPPSHANLAEIVSRLGSSHVLICEPGHRHRLRKIELNVPSDDVTFALKRNAQVTWLQKLAEQRS